MNPFHSPKRFTVCVDFDGVIHQYRTPWIAPHVIPDPIVEGAIEFLSDTIQDYNVVILTTRARTWRGRRAVRAFIKQHAGAVWYDVMGNRGLEEIEVTDRKPAALVYIDDRGHRFDGTWPTRAHVNAPPWNRR